MKLALAGVGGAGGRIVDRLLEAERRLDRACAGQNVLVFDTAKANLEALESVPEERRALLGDTYPGVDGTGVDGDVSLAVDAAREELNEIRRELDALEVYEADAVLVVAGLGGGTGAGVGAVLLEEFRTVYDKPVYAVGVLPSDAEDDDRALTAARALQSFVRTATNTLLFDNQAWLPAEPPAGEGSTDDGSAGDGAGASRDSTGTVEPTPEVRRSMNDALATRLVSLFGAGQLDTSALPESAVDVSDSMRTLATGGVSTIGYASTEPSSSGGLLAWLRSLLGGSDDEEVSDAVRITELVREALEETLTLPCDVSSAERAMLVLSGPPEAFSRKGFENAIHWLETETGAAEVLAGDEPRTGANGLTATVLLSNVADVPAIASVKERAHRGVDFVFDDAGDDADGASAGTTPDDGADPDAGSPVEASAAGDGQDASATGRSSVDSDGELDAAGDSSSLFE